MTKRKVNILMALMAISLIGIILLQLVWMKNALEVRNELFDRSVNEALIATSKRMETLSDVFWVQDLIKTEDDDRSFIPKLPKIKHTPQNVIIKADSFKYEFNSSTPLNKSIESKIKIISSDNNDSLSNDVLVEIIQMDSVINNWEKKIEHNITVMFDESMSNFDSTFTFEKKDIEQRVGKKKERLKNVAGRMFYETWSMDQEQLPDTAIIRSVLDEELQERDIPIHCEVGVIYGQNQLLKSSVADSILMVSSNYSTDLFPGNIFKKNEKLLVYFPERKTFIFKALIMPAFLSILFCGFIILVFGLSIYYIVNQKKISEMKSDFINNMTHEFKTPLATISVATDTIINPKIIDDSSKVKHFIDVIKKENIRMNQQVETILQIARLDKKEFEFNFKVHDIHELIDKAVQGILLQIQNRSGKVEVIKNALNPIVTTDAGHMLNLLNNLLDNANKYSPEQPEIKISTKNSDRGVWITVVDNGIGMSKQVQQKIFEKFYRETTGNIHNVKGFGLGLSYVKAVINANKGEVKVQSEQGKGSTFEIFVPFTLTT